MKEEIVSDIDNIQKAAESIMTLRPVYENILNFYKPVFLKQEESKNRVNIQPEEIADELLSIKAKEKFPLINISDFQIDMERSRELFIEICKIAVELNGDMSDTASVLLNGLEAGKIEPDILFYSIINGGRLSFLDENTDKLKIDKKIAALIIYSSIKPSIIRGREYLLNCLDADQSWEKGYCPICGSMPGLSMFSDDGGRFLICSFCWHKWTAHRIYCPFCENRDSETLQYFFSEEEDDYRVDLCDKCNQYIKTIDTRKTNHYIYPPLEMISTLHLDFQAQEKGYKNGMEVELEVHE